MSLYFVHVFINYYRHRAKRFSSSIFLSATVCCVGCILAAAAAAAVADHHIVGYSRHTGRRPSRRCWPTDVKISTARNHVMEYGDNVIYLIVHNPHRASYKNTGGGGCSDSSGVSSEAASGPSARGHHTFIHSLVSHHHDDAPWQSPQS